MAAGETKAPFFRTRGVVLAPQDLTLDDWPERAQRAGLNTIALHPTPEAVAKFVESEAGEAFLSACQELGLEVEYELHAMGELLPRSLFDSKSGLFRMNKRGDRVPDANLCVHSEEALDTVARNAVRIAKVLRPTTGRYFYWGDDGKPWCECPKCREFSGSDQALLLENHILARLHADEPEAQLAHLAYHTTLEAPENVAPRPGVFLEFAPIRRELDVPIDAPESKANRRHLRYLDDNLKLFRRDTAQVLEYWLDSSLFSRWKRPAVKIPFSAEVLKADLDAYGGRGIRHVTTFAVFVDADYTVMHGEPPIPEYGAALAGWPESR